MKLLSPLSGTAAVCMSGEEATPEHGLVMRDFISRVAQRYQFAVSPAETPGAVIAWQFQSGVYLSSETRFPITQLIVTGDGDAIIARNTDLADEVLTDYLEFLEVEMAYRLQNVKIERIYVSFLLVELEQAFVDSLFPAQVNAILSEALDTTLIENLSIKRWSAGNNASNYAPAQPTIMQFLPRDFIIERRANEPFKDNKFFCTAPLSTRSHVEILTKLEEIAMRRSLP